MLKQPLNPNCNIRDSIKEIRGISRALEFLHDTLKTQSDGVESSYCHLDLKPANILVFMPNSAAFPVGKWKLTDFGISSLSKLKKRTVSSAHGNDAFRVTHTVGTKVGQIGGRYQPPEIRLGNKEDAMGRGSDVWSLGCIFAEALAAKLESLQRLRLQMENSEEGKDFVCFYQLKKWVVITNVKLNPAFDIWLKELPNALGGGKPLFQDCYSLLKEMMEIQRIKRISAKKLVERMDNLIECNQ
jgi:serine/threonine protein kinase